MQIFKKLLFLLSSDEQKRSALLLIMIIIMALLDMLGVASILPFMTVLTNPNLIETHFILNNMFKFSNNFGIENSQQFIFALGIFIFIILVISLTFKAFTNYFTIRFVLMLEYSIGKRLVEGYLKQPYSWFLNQNSANLGKSILSEVSIVIGNGIKQFMGLISSILVVFAILILLLLVNIKITLIVVLTLGFTYLLIFFFVKRPLKKLGQKRLQNNQLRFKAVSEAFGAVKEIKVGGLEQSYIKNFSNYAKIFATTQSFAAIIGQLPRYILEAVAFGGILLVILYTIFLTGSLNNHLPIISLYVFSGYRLIPAMQQIYTAITQITFVAPGINKLYEEVEKIILHNENQDQDLLSFKNVIELKNIYFSYPNTTRTALQNINVVIPAKSKVGLVGTTGSGKTSTIDIILGLLSPQKGTLKVDGEIITSHNLRSWQNLIGYVPQHIYLSDDTVAANIGFGEDVKDINLDLVEKAARIANLHEFVINELPNQYKTNIGERGIRLSGGQRQRIGIARALYLNPQVLIFDEATSALDNQTEKAVMDAVNNVSRNITIIKVAHRLNTVKDCDKIFLFEKGRLKNEGTFEEVILRD
jgi:ABC-type multidrug transport system fused ATPase/permease subunit